MEGSTEERLLSLESRLDRVERLLSIGAPVPFVRAPAPPRRAEEAPPDRPARTRVDVEEVLGGRVLAWVGGVAVVLGVVFFLVMAVSRGWIDEPTRVALAFAGSTALLLGALWLYERAGQTQAALAAAAAALASLYASLTVATVVYGLIPAAAGVLAAALVGAAGAAIAVRWDSQVVGGIGILGALLAPVLVDAGSTTGALVFMAIALTAAVAVLVWRRWPWLATGAFVVSAPQLAAWIDGDRPPAPVLAVLVLYWALFLAAALAYELRFPTDGLRTSSALLLLADVLFVSAEGWRALHDAGRSDAATAWVLALAAAHVGVGVGALRVRVGREVGELMIALGVALSAVGLALALDGPALVAGWSAEAVLLAWVAARSGDERATYGAAGFLALALGHVLFVEAPPDSLANGLDDAARGLSGLAIVDARGGGFGAAELRPLARVVRERGRGDGGVPRLGRDRRRLRRDRRDGRDAGRPAPAERVLGRDRPRGGRRRPPARPSRAPPRRADAARARGREGVPRRPEDARVGVPRRLVRRPRPAADRRRVRLSARAALGAAVRLLLAVGALAVAASSVNASEFRWSRALAAPAGAGPIAFGADAPLFAHAGPGLAGLRIVDAHGIEVPWRPFPAAAAPRAREVAILDRGRRGGAAVALLDLGSHPGVHDRIDLDLPGHGFVGVATVSGSDDLRTFTRVGASRVFDLAGAGGRARSTAVAFAPSDFRYFRLRVGGVARIDGAAIASPVSRAAAKPVPFRRHGRLLDLGGANVPVDSIAVSAAAPRYDRPVRIEARNPGRAWRTVASGRVFRLDGTRSAPIPVGTSARYLRVTVLNGNDPPLAGVVVEPLARPRTVLVEGGHAEPLRLLYGGRPRPAPSYEFARLPRGTLGLASVRRGTLGPPRANADYRPRPDTRSWAARHPAVLDAALALAAAAVALAGFLALRRS